MQVVWRARLRRVRVSSRGPFCGEDLGEARRRSGVPARPQRAMTWLIPLGIALTSNLDNFAGGAALGAQRRKIAAAANLVVALITALATWGAMSLGASITHAVGRTLPEVIGALALIAIGLFSLAATFRRAEAAEHSGTVAALGAELVRGLGAHAVGAPGEAVSLAQAAALGVALSLNNLATGIAAGAAGVSTSLTTLAAAIFSFALVGLGAKLGALLAERVPRRASSVVGGVLLVTLGLAALVGR